LITRDEPETDTTLPVTEEKLPRLAGTLPLEPEPEGGVKLPPEGGAPPVAPPGPPPKLPPAPTPDEQVPDEDGELTITDWAVTLPLEVEPRTVTHSPVVMDAEVRVTVWWNAVEEVQLTVVWLEEPCTSIDELATDATFPDAPGKIRPEPEAPDDPAGAVESEVEPLDVLVEPPPQAARASERERATAAAERDLRVRVGTDPMRKSPCVSRGDIIRS
jgi:hypothetical protein